MEKQGWEESERRREAERRSGKRKKKKKEDAGDRKRRKVVIHFVFPMICGSGWSRSRLAKAVGAEPSGQMRNENLHTHICKWKLRALHLRSTFGSWDVQKLHAVVVRSACPSQNVQRTPGSDHFWKLRCRKSARHCGAKHMSKPKSTTHTNVGPRLEVEMSKKCAALWREARFQGKRLKTPHVRTTLGRSDVASCGKGRGLCTLSKVSKTWVFL